MYLKFPNFLVDSPTAAKSTQPESTLTSQAFPGSPAPKMSDKKSGAYGTSGGGDTDFRKTYDRDEYAQRAAERERKEAEESKARYEAKLAGKKYHRRASTPPDAREIEARASRLDVSSMVGKSTLVPAGASVGKRGKGAGFYCPECDLTFKDNHAYMDHLNSRQHLIATGQSADITEASVEDVRARLRWLARKRRELQNDVVTDLDTRIDMAREKEELEREEKRRKRNEKRRKEKDPLEMFAVKVENDGIIR